MPSKNDAPRCLHCNKTLAQHLKYTEGHYLALKRASGDHPVRFLGRLWYGPITREMIGDWVGHVPFIPGEEHTWKE